MTTKNIRDIPDELKELATLDNWVVWEFRERGGKRTKYPVNPNTPNTREGASSTDATTWADYKTARAALERWNYDGLGFMFGTKSQPSSYAGIDLDDAINDDGTLKEFAADIIKTMNAYTEYSPSRKGIHIIFKVMEGLSKDADKYKSRQNEIECYDSARFFTMTFDIWEGCKVLKPEYRDKECEQVREKYLKRQAAKTESRTREFSQPTRNYNYSLSDSDAEILQRMYNLPDRGKICEILYKTGDFSGFPSQSEADLYLCWGLALVTDGDASRMELLFKNSRLMRDKWDSPRGSSTYGNNTIQAVLSNFRARVNDIKRPESNSSQTEKKEQPTSQPTQQEEQPKKDFINDAQYLDSGFESDMKNFQSYSKRKTGFANLDEKIILYPALYCLGAISSLGKTTFALQLADNLAAAGEHVLFFAFEQSRFELVSKSLARLAQPDEFFSDTTPTALEIRNGRITDEVRKALQKFRQISEHKYIFECDFSTDINAIKNTVEEYIKRYGVKPIVFVDYLQLVKSDNPKLQNTKDITDANVRALKLLQMRNNLVMFVISSLNRQNYLTTIDFESFKESGSIEYTADCVMGLQLAVMNSKLFESDAKTTQKRKEVKKAKTESPRYVELCILKNRYGVSNESFYFQYYAKWDKFFPTSREVIDSIYPLDEDRRKVIKKIL